MQGLTNVFEEQADGVDTHATTHYVGGSDPIDLAKLGAIPATDKGAAGGVATLDDAGNVPYGQLGNASGPSLLDNGHLADPIDQRGGYVVPPSTYYHKFDEGGSDGITDRWYRLDSWAGQIGKSNGFITVNGIRHLVGAEGAAVRGYVGAEYGIDRWRIEGTVLVQSDGLKIEASGRIFQLLEGAESLDGKTVTCSVLFGVELLTGTLVFNSQNTEIQFFFAETLQGYASGNNIGIYAPTTVSGIIAAKLELGDTQTLAHRDENGNWVLNDPPPNKYFELLKCCMSTADSADSCANKTILHTGNVTAGTTDLTAGSSALAHGAIYQVYE